MFNEILPAVLKAGLPLGLASYALVWWTLKKNYVGSPVDLDDFRSEVKRLAKDKETKKQGDPVYRKWLAFGGGFYGLVGLLTYVLVELGEIRDFFLQFESISALISGISFDLIIGLMVDALSNFVVAIAWPVYWMNDIDSNNIWVWFAVAYGGYWAGARLALHRAKTVGL
jgi:hypothetical protein